MADINTGTEKQAWKQTANANDVNLGYVDLNDRAGMEELYGMLRVTGVAEKSRLRAFIAEQQNQQQVS